MKKLLPIFAAFLWATFSFAQSSLNFDGTNDYSQIPNSISTSSAFTIEFWMKTTQTGSSGSGWYNGNGLVDAEVAGSANDFGISLNDSKIAFGVGNPDISIFSTSNVNTGNWVHVAAVWNNNGGTDGGGTIKLYINGLLESSTLSGVPVLNRNGSATITLGAINTLNNYYNGNLDELRIWNTGRTQAQIQDNIKCAINTATNLVGYYGFNDGSANGSNTNVNSLADNSGNNKNGTLHNFALTGNSSNFTNNLVSSSPSVSITSSGTNPYGGFTLNITADSKFAGATPLYQWYKNGNPINGATDKTFSSSTLVDNDAIYCSITINGCGAGSYNSNTITMHSIIIKKWYVKAGAGGNGTSWANAGDLQTIINNAQGNSERGDTIFVAAGTYNPPTNGTFSMKEGVKILGGFPATGNPTLTSRNWQSNLTVLQAPYNNGNGSRVIVNSNNGLTAAAVLDGFTIKDGKDRSSDGGGMYNVSVSPTIRNCVFSNNQAQGNGGAVSNSYGEPTFINCTFSGNASCTPTAGGRGGGGAMANYYSKVTLIQCNFSGNNSYAGEVVSSGGGALSNDHSDALVTECTFSGNSGYNGGALHNYSSSPVYKNCKFLYNSSSMGGAMYNTSASINERGTITFENCIFKGNTASTNGGAAYNSFYSAQNFTNCVITGNSAPNGGGGGGIGGAIYNSYAMTNLYNCTLTGNNAANGGYSAIYSTNYAMSFSTVTVGIYNSVIYGNSGGVSLSTTGSVAQIKNSLVQSFPANDPFRGINVSTSNNIDGLTNPLFISANNFIGSDNIWGTADDGLLVQPCSPLIGSGDNGFIQNGITTDIAGTARIQKGTVDIGAYETNFNIGSGSIVYVDANAGSTGDGKSWSTAFKNLGDALVSANQCNSISSILVAKGTYYPTGLQTGSNRDSTFLIPQRGGIKLFGGYPNGGGTRNISANPTILSGDIGALGNKTDNSYHVMVMTNTLANADSVVVDGFTITKGNANGGQYSYNNQTTNQNEGGGLLLRLNINIAGKIAIRNCKILDNTSSASGAGIYLWQTSPFVSNCTLTGNSSGSNGGGIFAYDNSSATINNSIISNNSAAKMANC